MIVRRFVNPNLNRIAQIVTDERDVTLAYFMPSGRRISARRFDVLPTQVASVTERLVGKVGADGYREITE